MLLSETRDLFVLKYKLECRKRKEQEMELGNKFIAQLLAEGQDDISSKLKFASTSADITITAATVFTTYSLPANFGGLKGKPSIGGTDLAVKAISELPTSGTLSRGTPSDSECAIYYDGTGWKIYLYPLANAAATLKLWYYINTGQYSPAGVSAQNWGTFDGSTFTGNLKIPDDCLKALMYYMLKEIFNDFEIKYALEISRLRANNLNSIDDEIKYDIGGGISY